MAYVNSDPMPVPGPGVYHLFAPNPDNPTLCSWCGDTNGPHAP